jgi:hypothetical protein
MMSGKQNPESRIQKSEEKKIKTKSVEVVSAL